MKRSIGLVAASISLVVVIAGVSPAAQWHHPLYLPGDGYWRGRVRVVVDNQTDRPLQGRPVGVEIGSSPGMARLAGTRAEAIRLCNERGLEMLFGLRGPGGDTVTTGPVPDGGRLVIPAECGPRSSAVYYVYFDNRAAGRVPDFLEARTGLVNGDVERGQRTTPVGWKHDAGDRQHRAAWSTENPQSGRRCLKTVVQPPGAEPSWIATRQQGIAVVGGAKYRVTAWVKARDVVGYAGWYVHLGNRRDPMMIAPMLRAGAGTFDWKQVSLEFDAPADADLADLGTVLRGTGTAWFDNVTFECLQPGNVTAAAEQPQRLELRQIGADAPWPDQGNRLPPGFPRRAVVKVFNFTAEDVPRRPILVDASTLAARCGCPAGKAGFRVTSGGKPIGHGLLWGDTLCFDGRLPARSVATYRVYVAPEKISEPVFTQPPAALTAGNLLKNPSFQRGEKLPQDWAIAGGDAGPGGPVFARDDLGVGRDGNRCAKMHVPHNSPPAWRGWRQTVPVRPGRTYLLAGRLKGEDLRDDVQIHVHLRDAAGQLCRRGPMRSIGPAIRGTTAWTRLSGTIDTPQDAARLEIHLTMNTSGTLWHDELLLAEVTAGTLVGVEGRRMSTDAPPAIWPVTAIRKVFPDDPASTPGEAAAGSVARISLAGNEKEPLQLAVRSGRAMRAVKVEVDPPVGPGGVKLDDVEVNVVGYVPIDHPTSYYRAETPAWHRKVPTQPGRCDGWPGMWPDPLLPTGTFDLKPNKTQAIWVTFGAGKRTPPGDYVGRVRLVCDGRKIGEQEFSVHVWDFTLPDESHLAAIYDVRLGPGGRKLWGKDLDELHPEIMRFMARRRLCPDTVRPAPSIKYENGRVVADFAAFDKAAEIYFDRLKLPFAYTPWSFYLFGWAHPPKRLFGELPYPGPWPHEGVDRGRLRPQYKRAYQACLKVFWDHLKERGWDRRFVLYVSDEPHDRHPHIVTQMKALCDMIHQVDPAIAIYSSTWKHVPDWDGSLDVWGISHYGRVPLDQMERLRAAGDRMWFTTDGQMCTDTPYCGVERLLPHYCFKYGVEAYEFWGVSWLTYDPYRYGWHSYIRQADRPGAEYWVRYPNGDGYLIYPGGPIGHEGPVSSIRLEQAREGVEDYEYLYLLRRLMAKAKAAGRDATEAQLAMQRAAALVSIPNPGGRYSTRFLPQPEDVFQVKRSLARAIEALNKSGAGPILAR